MTLTAKDVAEITRLLEQSSFDELHLECDGLKFSLRRHSAAPPAAPGSIATAAVPAAAQPQPLPTPLPVAKPDAPADDATVEVVRAPLLGTYYRAPKPGAPPFIEVGAHVDRDTIIGIIEVMKLMNTVRAGVRGTVVSIEALDGALVEYGATLLRVRKDADS